MHEFFSTLNTKPTEIFLCDEPLVNLLPSGPHPRRNCEENAGGNVFKTPTISQPCSGSGCPWYLFPGSSSLPQTPSLFPSLEITGSHHLPPSLLDHEPSQCLLEHAAPCSLPISTRAKQNRTDGQPRSHSSTSVYLKPPLASFLLVDKTKLKEGSEHLLEEPYPEVPAGELT